MMNHMDTGNPPLIGVGATIVLWTWDGNACTRLYKLKKYGGLWAGSKYFGPA